MWLTLNQILTAFGSKTKAPLKVLLKNATFASGLIYRFMILLFHLHVGNCLGEF